MISFILNSSSNPLVCVFLSCLIRVWSESTLWGYLNVKELTWNKRNIWRWNDCNGTRTHNQLVRKQTLNHSVKLASLAKWLSVRLGNRWLWVQIPLQSFKTSSFTVNINVHKSFTLSEHLDKRNLQTNLFTNEIQTLNATLEFSIQDFLIHIYELQIKDIRIQRIHGICEALKWKRKFLFVKR